ncbi:MAG: 23S rRNA (guanosine(2251)-2'-O)-methyltransferase RlmB [Candidatus Riflebacteria bacterium]|nr:23S rRNA (guanosine(2251)-2'-O)-methyltransferase RlmB [Candidatus Riflebacteria bacterium]
MKEHYHGKKVPPQKGHPSRQSNPEQTSLWVRGRHEVFSVLKSDQQITRIFLGANATGGLINDIRLVAEKRKIQIEAISSELLEQKSGGKCQGCAALIKEFQYKTLDAVLDSVRAKKRVVLCALNNVEDPRNLGAIIRTAEAAGAAGVIIPERRSAGVTEWAISTSQGAAFSLPIIKVVNLGDTLEKLKAENFWIVGLSEASPKRYDEFEYPEKVVLVAGGEDVGLGSRVKSVCDETVRIPLLGCTPSLNVSVSVAIALFEIQRKFGFENK